MELLATRLPAKIVKEVLTSDQLAHSLGEEISKKQSYRVKRKKMIRYIQQIEEAFEEEELRETKSVKKPKPEAGYEIKR